MMPFCIMAVVKLYNVIGEKQYSSDQTVYNSATEIVSQLEAAVESEDAEVTFAVASPGGRVSHGVIIQNAVARLNQVKPIVGVIEGIAASMGYLVLLPAQKIKGYKNILILTHGVQGSVKGSSEDMIAEAETMKKFNVASAQYLMQRTGLNQEEVIEKFLSSDKWWTAKEALEAKLIDEIIDADAENVPANVSQQSYDQFIDTYMKKETQESTLLQNFTQALRTIFTPTQSQPEQALIDTLGYAEQEFFSDLVWAEQIRMRAAQYAIKNGTSGAIKTEAQAVLEASLTAMTDLIKRVYGENTDATQQAETIFTERTQKLEKVVEKVVAPSDEKIQEVAQTLIAEQVQPLQQTLAEKELLITQLQEQVAELSDEPAGKPARTTSKEPDNSGAEQSADDERYMTSYDREKQQLNKGK
jgi:ATP-dependent protease ClpP protease subunit